MPDIAFLVEPEEQALPATVEGDVLSIPITEEVGGWGFGLRDLLNALKGFSGSRIEIPINTYGGEVFEGLAIYNTLKGRPEEIVTRVVGYAVSMGSILFMAGARREMPERGYLMIHNPTMGVYGDSEDIGGVKTLLEKMTNTLAEIYAQTTGLTKNRILRMMDEETWLDAKDALALGFVTDIVPGAEIRAHLSEQQLAGFTNVPAELLHSKKDEMKLNEKLMSAINGLAEKLEGFTASGAVSPGNTATATADATGDDADDDDDATGGQTAASAGTEPDATTGTGTTPPEADEDDEGAAQLVQILERLAEQNAQLLERQTALEERITQMAARLKNAEGKVAKAAAKATHPATGNSGTPDASRAEAAFRRKAQVLRPGNEVKID